MTIEHIMLLASVAQTPRDWAEVRAAILALLAESDGQWKAAVIEGLMVSHCYKAEHETDPRKALADLISWHVAVALDPCVSSDAVKLQNDEALLCMQDIRESSTRGDAADKIYERVAKRRER